MRLAACYWAHLDEIIYATDAVGAVKAGFDDVLIREECSSSVVEQRMPMRQNLRAEALEIFTLWQTLENKTEY